MRPGFMSIPAIRVGKSRTSQQPGTAGRIVCDAFQERMARASCYGNAKATSESVATVATYCFPLFPR
jgi:hypothetical protein